MTHSLSGSPLDAWWRHAVIYQVYPRSFADSDGDGIGDLPGITSRLPYLAELGVDAIWISPFYVSPMADAGYDVADYRDIDPLFGTLADAEALLARAHELGLKVIVDLVPNHTSDEHAWFAAALEAGPGSPERGRYLFREGKGPDGSLPPNDWGSVFGGSAWTRIVEADGQPGQWYLHLFDPKQPDLNWDHPEVRAEFESILHFWLERGVDGFRVDVAHALVKDPLLPDWQERAVMAGSDAQPEQAPMWDQPGVHEIYRSWRRILQSYNPSGDPKNDRVLVAEAWLPSARATMDYVRPDEMHQAFNFHFLQAPWRAESLRQIITDSLQEAQRVGAPSTWVLSNHDVVRHASRLGLPVGTTRPNGIAADDPQPNAVLGLARARAATALMLALPGSAYLYYGEELGLPEHTALPDHLRQDPAFVRTEGTEAGRDGCRIPMPWTSAEAGYGFGPSERTWLPQPLEYGALAVDRQESVPGSTLETYRELLALRKEYRLGMGQLQWLESPPEVLAFTVDVGDGTQIQVWTNLGSVPQDLPADAHVLISSGPLTGGQLPQDTTAWLRG